MHRRVDVQWFLFSRCPRHDGRTFFFAVFLFALCAGGVLEVVVSWTLRHRWTGFARIFQYKFIFKSGKLLYRLCMRGVVYGLYPLAVGPVGNKV